MELAHQQQDGHDQPIAFASRTLTEAERKYSQLEKEGLACVYGVTRFHSYVCGSTFTLITDHKRLQRLLGSHCNISPQAAEIKLAYYEYKLEFRPTHQRANTDAGYH